MLGSDPSINLEFIFVMLVSRPRTKQIVKKCNVLKLITYKKKKNAQNLAFNILLFCYAAIRAQNPAGPGGPPL